MMVAVFRGMCLMLRFKGYYLMVWMRWVVVCDVCEDLGSLGQRSNRKSSRESKVRWYGMVELGDVCV